MPAGPVEIIVAVAENDVIGRANRLPWRLSADLRRFKAMTWGKPILMGRKTHESIGRALPGRDNIVMTRSKLFAAEGCVTVDSLEAARQAAGLGTTLMVIGGAEVYRQCLPMTTRIHLTLVHAVIEGGDAFFPDWHRPQWREHCRESHTADEHNEYAYSFITLDRVVS
jgi:dihydrofolate reductase